MNTLSEMDFSVITEKEAKERFNLTKYFKGFWGDNSKYLLYDGDVIFEADMNTFSLCQEGLAYADGIIINGNLTIKGILNQPDGDSGETLFVSGNLKAKSINKGGAQFYIKGNVEVEQTIYGYYNHGSLVVEGDTKATTIFAEDHSFRFGGLVTGLIINTGVIEGPESDYTTTEPLLPELKMEDNEHYSNAAELHKYIKDGKNIIQESYRK